MSGKHPTEGLVDPIRTSRFWAATAVYLFFVGAASLFYWRWFTALKPDAWGNFLAGVFSPLAFLWLVYTALAQKAELSLQRDELSQNNETQRLQQEQMQRQADALNAQVARLAAQADAQYQPIFILTAVPRMIDAPTTLALKNIGQSVLNVRAEANCRIQNYSQPSGHPERAHGNLVPYLKQDGTMILEVDRLLNDNGDAEFDIRVTRLDLQEVVYRYHFNAPVEQMNLIARNDSPGPYVG